MTSLNTAFFQCFLEIVLSTTARTTRCVMPVFGMMLDVSRVV